MLFKVCFSFGPTYTYLCVCNLKWTFLKMSWVDKILYLDFSISNFWINSVNTDWTLSRRLLIVSRVERTAFWKKRSKGSNNVVRSRPKSKKKQRSRRWRKKSTAAPRRSGCKCGRSITDECLSTALKYQQTVSAFIANLNRQETR